MSLPHAWKHIEERLEQRRRAGLWREVRQRCEPQRPCQTVDGVRRLSFCSNDYLGLAAHPALIAALEQGGRQYGVGSGASHMVNGHCRVHHQLEEALADHLERDRVLLFSTGYMANTGILHALMRPGGAVWHDALNHASLLDGGWLCRAGSFRYPHRDVNALDDMLSVSTASHHLVATDGVFSMDGDLAPLGSLIDVAHRHQALLMVDDAHGIGTLGLAGRGVIDCPDSGRTVSQRDLPLLVGTMGKAFGTSGAFVAGPAGLIEYLRQFARSHVFTTAMPPAIAAASLAALRLIRQEGWRRERLRQLVDRFREGALALGLELPDSHTPIQAVILGSASRAMRGSAILGRIGLHVPAIRPPSVPEQTARLRITFSARHTVDQVDRLLAGLDLMNRELELEP
ncbi:MAG: aminotransferase class I/II-fold pyridoxal phosphate-dependent enzyme [Pseudomonadota bacterium]